MSAPLASTLSVVGGMIRKRLADEFGSDSSVEVILGTPAAAENHPKRQNIDHLLNLFFYRIEPAGFFQDNASSERWFVRIRCLVTAFSTSPAGNGPDAETLSEGEIDLRVIGEVLRYFGENPVITPAADEDLDVQIQIVFAPLNTEEINQIWSTQGDVAYRPSIAYEIALVPVEPNRARPPALPVVAGGASLSVHADMARAGDPPGPPRPFWPSPSLEVDLDDPGWAPAIAFVSGGEALQVATAPFGTDLKLWIAGPAGETVALVWQEAARSEWKDIAGALDVAIPAQNAPVSNGVIDPARAAAAELLDATVPGPSARYLLLYAERRLPDGSSRRSNPLIVAATEGGGP